MQVAGYLVRRVAASLLTLVIASVVSFGISEILPGNAATANLGRDATAEQVRLLEQRLHLDDRRRSATTIGQRQHCVVISAHRRATTIPLPRISLPHCAIHCC